MQPGISAVPSANGLDSISSMFGMSNPVRCFRQNETTFLIAGASLTALLKGPASPDEVDSEYRVISVSVTFNINSNLDVLPPEVVLVSADNVYFYVHYHKLMQASSTQFGAWLPATKPVDCSASNPLVVVVKEPAAVLNVVLYIIYGMRCNQHFSSFDVVAAAVRSLDKYGVRLRECLASDQPLYHLILTRAPLDPVEAFAIAGENQIEDLAVSISPYLLRIWVDEVPNETAIRIGPVYLKRMFSLQRKRVKLLHVMISEAPYPHPPTPRCSPSDRQALSRAWTLAVSALVMNSSPGESPVLLVQRSKLTVSLIPQRFQVRALTSIWDRSRLLSVAMTAGSRCCDE